MLVATRGDELLLLSVAPKTIVRVHDDHLVCLLSLESRRIGPLRLRLHHAGWILLLGLLLDEPDTSNHMLLLRCIWLLGLLRHHIHVLGRRLLLSHAAAIDHGGVSRCTVLRPLLLMRVMALHGGLLLSLWGVGNYHAGLRLLLLLALR